MPAKLQYKHMRMSSLINTIPPIIWFNAPKYRPPESWKVKAKNTYIQGCIFRGIISRNIGITNGPFNIGAPMGFNISLHIRH